jgi:hypothetical protein
VQSANEHREIDRLGLDGLRDHPVDNQQALPNQTMPLRTARLLTLPKALVTLVALAAVSPAQAQNQALQRCPKIDDAAVRLACYDAILPPATASAIKPAVTQPTAPAAAAAPGAVATQIDGFGLASSARNAELAFIESAVNPDFDGWAPNQRISLQNGQVWVVVDGSSGSLRRPGGKVTVRRGLLGSFFMDFEGLTRAPRVNRVQ